MLIYWWELDGFGNWLLVTSDALSWIETKETRWVEMRAIDGLMLLENTGKMWTTRSLIYSHMHTLPCCHAMGPTLASSKVALALHLLAKRLWSFILQYQVGV
jgi:hypothetical protein